GAGERPAVEQQPAVADDADDRRLALAERRGKLLLHGAREARQLGERQRPAADARHGLLDGASDEPGEALGPPAHGLGRLVEHPQHRYLAERASGIEVERERSLERRQRQLVGAERALERVAPQPLDELRAARDDSGLRPAEELVSREADEISS